MDVSGSIRSAVVCTGNRHKVVELARLLADFELEPLPAGCEPPPEIGATFLDNARIKAHAGHALFPDRWVIADDSGLIVDALGGAPGVHSARFAGADATDAQNTAQLLERLEGREADGERAARFACVLVMVAPDGSETVAEGFVEGRIAHVAAGNAGFGYDPVFVPEGFDASFAELGDDVKAEMSHRARAARQLHERLLTHA